MSVKRRQFTSQFKAKVAMEAMKGQRTIGELAGLYQVHPSRIAAWKKHLVEYSAMAFEESSVQGSDRSSPALMAQLYEQIGRLQVELSWLKKSLDWTPDQKRQAVDDRGDPGAQPAFSRFKCEAWPDHCTQGGQ